jgi:hypothetical protein
MDRFVAAWRGSLVPLRRKFGFEIDGAWVDLERNRFVWLVSYDGADGFEARDAAYYDSSDRAALDPDPADLIVESEHLFVETVSLD